MKKLVLTIAFFGIGSIAFAQQKTTIGSGMSATDTTHKRGDMKKQYAAKMQQELGLTPTQVDQIQALNAKDKASWKVKTESNIEDKKAMKAAHEAEMKKILTPEQYTKWQTLKAERKNEMKNKNKEDRGMKAPVTSKD